MNTHVSMTLEEIEVKIKTLTELRDLLRETFGMDAAQPGIRDLIVKRRKIELEPKSKFLDLKALPIPFDWRDVAKLAGIDQKCAQGRISNWLRTGKIVRCERGKYKLLGTIFNEALHNEPKAPAFDDIPKQIAASKMAKKRAEESGNTSLAALHQKQIDRLEQQ